MSPEQITEALDEIISNIADAHILIARLGRAMGDDTAELKRLMEAGTPGPWYLGSQNDAVYIIDGPPSPAPYDGPIPKQHGPAVIATPEWRDMPSEANAALIVAAVNALPDLLARVEELEEAISNVMRKHHPYENESGVVEVPLHTFGRLVAVSREERERVAVMAAALKGGA